MVWASEVVCLQGSDGCNQSAELHALRFSVVWAQLFILRDLRLWHRKRYLCIVM